MVRFFFVVISCLILLSGVAVRQLGKDKYIKDGRNSSPEVLSVEEKGAVENQESDTVTSATQSITITTTETPTPTISQPGYAFGLASFIYPHAQLLEQNETNLHMTSNEPEETITQWYQDKIIGEGINVRSFVKTKTNGNVLNKLVGAKDSDEVIVEITKEAESDTTNILVTINNK